MAAKRVVQKLVHEIVDMIVMRTASCPLCSSTILPDDVATSSWSRPTSPNSLIMTAALASSGWRRR